MNEPRPDDDDILPVSFSEALSERYLSYALSTITSRSLPDVRDGLKPVQRRILYAMRALKLDPQSGYKKCARVVGDVMGKFHPHGDGAIYDALVRLAQEFAQRYPLIDGQGNFGNVDGDNAAAMRYTEARLSAVAMALLSEINEDTVDFRATYDGNEDEPVVLPAAFPNLLANGTTGIAVGMATSIPPHNAGELCDGLIAILDQEQAFIRKEATEKEVAHEALAALIPGPDLPTGGIIIDPPETLREIYATGRGSVRLRARYEVEQLGQGQYQVIVKEIPYQVQKSRLMERIADLYNDRKLPLLGDVRDESTEDIRLVLVPRARTVDAELMMEQLFKLTELENRVSFNMNVLDAQGVPQVMSLRTILSSYLDHRMIVLERRSNFRLGKIAERINVLEGFMIAFLDLDEVIRIIREEDDAKAELMRHFKLNEAQAEAILNLRLRNLRKLEEMELRTELKELKKEQKELQSLLKDRGLRLARLHDETRNIKETFGSGALGDRRTSFAEAPVINLEEASRAIDKQPVTIICSEKSWIRVQKGHGVDPADLKYKDGDGEGTILAAQTTDRLLAISTDGRFYTLAVDKLPGGRGAGEPINLHVDLAKGAELHSLRIYRPGGSLIIATEAGRGFQVEEDAIIAQTKNGKQVVNIDPLDRLQLVQEVRGTKVAVIGTHRKLLIFNLSELPVMTRGKGVILQRYRGAKLSDLITLDDQEALVWPMLNGNLRRETDLFAWQGTRGSTGRAAPRGFPADNRFDTMVRDASGKTDP